MTLIAFILREMTELRIIKDSDGVVSICKDCNNQLESFIDIYTEDEDTPALFKTVDDAVLFAEIILKLLEVIT